MEIPRIRALWSVIRDPWKYEPAFITLFHENKEMHADCIHILIVLPTFRFNKFACKLLVCLYDVKAI